MSKPTLLTFSPIAEMMIQKYERYLPTAFDETMSLVEKVNKIIIYLNDIGEITNQMLEKWNEVISWVTNDGVNEVVSQRLDTMIQDGTLNDIINAVLFDELNQKIDVVQLDVDARGINVKNLGAICDGVADDTLIIQQALDTGKDVFVPGTTKISTLTLNTRNQHLTFAGKLTITGNGIVLNNIRQHIQAKDIVGESVNVVNGIITPLPTQRCAFDVKSAFCEVVFDSIEGFASGLLFADGYNGTENTFYGTIQRCDKAVNLVNASSGRHEGNTFHLRIFSCNVGYDIDAWCKYQNINGVIDNATVTNSLDINDFSGNHKITPYFVRLSNSVIGPNCIIFNFNGVGFVKIGENSSNNIQINPNSIELTGESPFIDVRNDSTKDYDYRFIKGTTETGQNSFNFIGGSNPTLQIRDDGYVALPRRREGNYGGTFANFTLPINPSPGQMFFAYDTSNGIARMYFYIAGGWKYATFAPVV